MTPRAVTSSTLQWTLALLLMVGWSPRVEAARPYAGGAVAAAHPLASQAGKAMLDQGGNAVDAAVAAAFVMAVVGPYHSGLGGGGFALVHLKASTRPAGPSAPTSAGSTSDFFLDFREVAPAGASRDMFVRDGKPVPQLSTDGPLSVAVPGAPAGYLALLERFGTLPPRVVLRPAIEAARKGFRVTPQYRNLATTRIDCLRRDSEAARIFLAPGDDGDGGEPVVPALGTRLVQPELARTLEGLARDGAKAFYGGRVAAAIEQTLQAGGGILTRKDLADYRVRWRAPLEGSYRNHRILTAPPPSAGGLAILQVLAGLEAAGPSGPAARDVDTLHRFVELLRRSYAQRSAALGDPAFVDIPLAKLASPEHAAAMLGGIDPKRATPSASLVKSPVSGPTGAARPPPTEPEKKHTTHLSVIDRNGNAVALTTTVNYYFGACVVAKGTGVLLNDEMDDFSVAPGQPNLFGLVGGEANAVAPGKIPLSSMSPTLVFAPGEPSRVMLAVGAPGGSTIPTTVLQVISSVIDGKLDVARAVGRGRIHHQFLPDELRVETLALEPSTIEALEARGHKVVLSRGWGDAEAVMVDPSTGLVSAASDPRNEGAPSGQDE